jgi:mannose-6-phosphate isomerase-like protein (cupin superfamily)
VVVDFAVEEGGFVPAGEHVHDNCSEHFEVLEGRLTFVVNEEERTLALGEQATVSPGAAHRWWYAGEGEVGPGCA